MVIYNRQEKVIIIPDCGCSSVSGDGHSRCEREVQIAYTSGWSGGYEQGLEDCSGNTCNLITGSLDLNNGDSGRWIVYPDDGYDGFDQFRVYDQGYGEGKYQEGYAAGYNSASTREIQLRFEISSASEFRALWRSENEITINGAEGIVDGVVETMSPDFAYLVTARTIESAVTTMEMTFNYQNSQGSQAFPYPPSAFTSVKVNDCYYLNILSQSRVLVQDGTDLKYKYSFTFDTTPFYDKLSYEAGLAACQQQIHNTINVQNEAAGHNIRGFVPGSQRDLMINGSACPYNYTIDGDIVFGYDAQFNLEADIQLAVPQSFAFTVDCGDRWADQNGPDLSSVAVFGNLINNYTVVKTPTTAINSNSLGIIYTITIS